MQSGSHSASRGFTLIEVLFATFVLAVAAVALAAALASAKRLTESPRAEMTARAAIQAKFAEINATPFPEIVPGFQNRGFTVTGLKAPPGDADGLPGEVFLAYGPDGNTRFYTVTLRVTWREGTQTRNVESVRYVANVRGDTGTAPPLYKGSAP